MKPALFLHIQKTAGTSVQEMARSKYGSRNVISHADYRNLGIDGCQDRKFISGHFGFEFAKNLAEGRYFFTFLREPSERLFSLYKYHRKGEGSNLFLDRAAARYDIYGFLRAALDSEDRSQVWNNQVWQLSYGYGANMVSTEVGDITDYAPSVLLEKAKQNINSLNYVGLVETFDGDVFQIFKNMGAKSVDIRKSNVSVMDANRSHGKKTYDLIEEITQLDRELYAHVLQLKSQRSRKASAIRLNLRNLLSWRQ